MVRMRTTASRKLRLENHSQSQCLKILPWSQEVKKREPFSNERKNKT
jgi:hypothetical protein